MSVTPNGKKEIERGKFYLPPKPDMQKCGIGLCVVPIFLALLWIPLLSNPSVTFAARCFLYVPLACSMGTGIILFAISTAKKREHPSAKINSQEMNEVILPQETCVENEK